VIFTPAGLGAVTLVDIDPREDERGFFARTYCREEFTGAGLAALGEQCSLSFNHRAGTLRGMHYQVAPVTEAKLVRCSAGAVLDQVVDLQPGSPTYLRSFAVELTADNHTALYVPAMFAHGFQVLADRTEVLYQMSEAQRQGSARGLRYDDPALDLSWPLPVTVISDADRSWALLPDP